MKSLRTVTRIVKPAIVVNNSSEQEIGNGNMDITYNFIVNFNYEQIVNRQGVQVWQQNYICINEPLSYNLILSHLVKAKYDDDDILAIALNYNNPFENNEKQLEHKQEYEELQLWRATAKNIAKEAYEYAVNNHFPVAE